MNERTLGRAAFLGVFGRAVRSYGTGAALVSRGRVRRAVTVSGILLWLSARDARFRWEGPIVVHDALTYASIVLVLGHLYLAGLHPATRHELRGMTRGDVREDWARAHHAKWVESRDSERRA